MPEATSHRETMSGSNRATRLKVCIAASAGGHLVQAKCLAKAYTKYGHFYFTFSGPIADDMKKSARVRTIPNIVRTRPHSVIAGIVLSAYIAAVERPDVVISTGASVTVFFCLFAKLLGAKLVFLESMAKVTRPTVTARILYPFSDLFLVQWPDLKAFFPKAQYVGRLF